MLRRLFATAFRRKPNQTRLALDAAVDWQQELSGFNYGVLEHDFIYFHRCGCGWEEVHFVEFRQCPICDGRLTAVRPIDIARAG